MICVCTYICTLINPASLSTMEPQTPPHRRTGFPHTPSTPRYGPMEDVPHKQLERRTAAVVQPPTPRQTPKRRALVKTHTALKGSGRQGKRPALTKIDEGIYTSTSHPHDPVMSRSREDGMWYVFRGKRVWRPFEHKEKPLKPVRLFEDMTDTSLFEQQLGESEADTDIEWN